MIYFEVFVSDCMISSRPYLGICIPFKDKSFVTPTDHQLICLLKLHQYQSGKLSVKELIKSCDILKKDYLEKVSRSVYSIFCLKRQWFVEKSMKRHSIVLVSYSFNPFFQRSSSGLSRLYTIYGVVFDEKVSSLP